MKAESDLSVYRKVDNGRDLAACDDTGDREMDDAEDELSMDDRSSSIGSRDANFILHFAVQHYAPDLAECILDHGADVNSILEGDSGDYWLDYDEDGEDLRPLHRAVRNDCVDMAKLLVKRGADIEAGPGKTPLVMAVINESTNATSFLLSSGANIEARDEQECEQTPLMWAAGGESLEVVQLLLNFGAAIEARSDSGKTPLIHAILHCFGERLEMIQLLLKHGAAVEARDNTGTTPLMFAIMNDDLEIAQLLLNFGAAVEARYDLGKTPLMYAIWDTFEERLKMVQLLLKHGAAVEARDNTGTTPLMYAIKGEDLKIVQSLLKFRATVDPQDSRGATALHYAASWPEGLESLIGARASVGAGNLDGETALHLTKSVESIDLLLSGGLEIDARDKKSMTALLKASQTGDKIVVEHLLKRGASPSAKSPDGTPLHMALSAKDFTNRPSVVQILLEYGADVNARRPSDGMTPLHAEALHHRQHRLTDLGVLHLLCKHGANPYLPDNESKTAFDYLEGHEVGISVLRSYYQSHVWPQLE
ncbi:MAG: hypothetical protein Q9178_003266 [Gyalolechia marmorata]